jgi:UDP-glucuronate 4-epimerase
VARRLLEDGRDVVGIDNLNAYYDPGLKEARLTELVRHENFRFCRLDLGDRDGMAALFADHGFVQVVHLAAQAGVRYSLSAPHDYIDSNVTGFLNVLEGCRHTGARHLLYASSSSVYGANTAFPFSVSQNVDHPLSLYGATKKANELMAHAYAHLFNLPVTGLRFFTVYGPWGRPDMAIWLFTAAILQGRPIRLFNGGDMRRDFTYVDDVSSAVVKLLDHVAERNPAWSGDRPDPATSRAPWRIYNIGNHTPVPLMEVVALLEEATGKKAIRDLLPMQPGDVHETCADVTDLQAAVGFAPDTPVAVGITNFVEWYRAWHGV